MTNSLNNLFQHNRNENTSVSSARKWGFRVQACTGSQKWITDYTHTETRASRCAYKSQVDLTDDIILETWSGHVVRMNVAIFDGAFINFYRLLTITLYLSTTLSSFVTVRRVRKFREFYYIYIIYIVYMVFYTVLYV